MILFKQAAIVGLRRRVGPGAAVSFGEDLRTERERREISLESVALGTKVPTHHLLALEQERYEDLPGGVFNKGIVRSYCQFLGLDAGPWLERLPESAIEESSADWAEFADNVQRSRSTAGPRMGLRWWGVLLMALAVAAAGWVAWQYLVQPKVFR
jgi:cytoskeletal protein RodZ